MKPIDLGLLAYATERQKEIIGLAQNGLSVAQIGNKLNVNDSYIRRTLSSLAKRAKREGYVRPKAVFPGIGKKILVIPDVQAMPNIDMRFLYCIGEYAVAKKPPVWLCLGDFADMPSLCSYDKGKRSYEGARYRNDIEAAHTAMKVLLEPLNEYNRLAGIRKEPLYEPELIMLLGNHEYRIERATQLDPMLYGTISIKDLKYEEFGWKVIPFLEHFYMDGIVFSHYFVSGTKGAACSTAQAQLNTLHSSCISGHQQGRQTATSKPGSARRMTSIIAGSAYDFDLDYLGHQGNKHWRGVIMLHNVDDGEFDEVPVPIEYLKKRYGQEKGSMFCSPKEEVKK